jgi:hypothetical protein
MFPIQVLLEVCLVRANLVARSLEFNIMSNVPTSKQNMASAPIPSSQRRRRNRRRKNQKSNQQIAVQPNGVQNQRPRNGARRTQRSRRARAQNYLGFTGPMPLYNRGLLGVGVTKSIARNRRDMVIEESEYVGEVTVANQPNFNNVAYAINPGNATMFPWLSTIAKQFEKYRFESLVFIYRKEVSEFTTGGQTGKVMMSVDFDASDPPPATKQQIEDTMPHADAMPCESFDFPIDPRDLLPSGTDAKYVRTAGLPGSTDIKTYDIGNLNVATSGVTVNTAVGELHVAYRVTLMKPVLENLAGPHANNSVSFYINSASTALTTATPINMPFTVSTNGVILAYAAGVFTPPPGNYIVAFQVQFTFGGSGSLASAYLSKNGGVVGSTAQNVSQWVAPDITSVPISQTVYVSCNGTDTLSVVVDATFSTSTCVVNGTFLAESV